MWYVHASKQVPTVGGFFFLHLVAKIVWLDSDLRLIGRFNNFYNLDLYRAVRSTPAQVAVALVNIGASLQIKVALNLQRPLKSETGVSKQSCFASGKYNQLFPIKFYKSALNKYHPAQLFSQFVIKHNNFVVTFIALKTKQMLHSFIRSQSAGTVHIAFLEDS